MADRTVVLGLSGGVDSAVSASLLMQSGFEVHGLYLDIGLPGGAESAEEAAANLGIPLTVTDIRDELTEKVCRPFAEAYLRGQTPNPCILCNPAVKFTALCRLADSLGAERIATGHYARAENGLLKKGMPANDQSYMLCRLTREQVRRLILPLGELEKAAVRAMAERLGLASAHKPDSMEICFIPDGDYAAFIERFGTVPPEGNFVDPRGNVLGRHRGIHRCTIGQRRGLGIAAGRRVFVSEIRPETNEVVLSDGDGLYLSEITARDVNWLADTPEEFSATVRVRHSKVETPARITRRGSDAQISFGAPVRAPTPGQSAVMYGGDTLLGGGFIL